MFDNVICVLTISNLILSDKPIINSFRQAKFILPPTVK